MRRPATQDDRRGADGHPVDRRTGRIDPHTPMWRHASALPLALVVFDASGSDPRLQRSPPEAARRSGEHERSEAWLSRAPDVIGGQRPGLHPSRRSRLCHRSVVVQRRLAGTGDGTGAAAVRHRRRRRALHRLLGREPRRRSARSVATWWCSPRRRPSIVSQRRLRSSQQARTCGEVFDTVARSMAGHPMAAVGVVDRRTTRRVGRAAARHGPRSCVVGSLSGRRSGPAGRRGRPATRVRRRRRSRSGHGSPRPPSTRRASPLSGVARCRRRPDR